MAVKGEGWEDGGGQQRGGMGRGTVPLLRLVQMRVHEHLHSHSSQSWFTDPSRVKTTDAIKNERRQGKIREGVQTR